MADDVTLVPITEDNLLEALRLKVSEAQNQFVAPVPVSLAQAAYSPHAWVRAIAHGDVLVGFAMLDVGSTPADVNLWRFLIHHEHQGRGFGRQALTLLVAEARARGAARMSLSYVPAEGNPGPFYASLGFQETGKMEGNERVMVLELEAGEPPPDARRAVAARFRDVADELEQAARHARVAARHLASDEVPRSTAHAWACRGHVVQATATLDDLARTHAAKART
ncbi:MAG: GNAT family N-acetyltransferase [Myxococcales bacterium]|nr:GNAT family N-acetyltransferase [Myxococcales bacterium]